MPELPEVHTVIQTLKKSPLINSKIKSVEIFISKVIKNTSPLKFKNFMLNEVIIDIERKGKYLLFKLTHNKYWLVHLRMEGKLFVLKETNNINKNHLMVLLHLDNNFCLGYYDSRMFGTFHVYNSLSEVLNSKELSKVAIDPFDKEFDAKYLYDKIKGINRVIKTTLLDQSIVSGIGNIYADEILYKCGINPLRPSKKLSLSDCQNIVKYSKEILNDSIKHKGTTIFSFKFDKNHSGEYQSYLQVHTRENQRCHKCGTKIIKIKVNGRGTYYCPKCQAK